MPCDPTATMEALCESGIGEQTDQIRLLRYIAQNLGDLLVATAPGTDITVAAIQERACESGIWQETNPIVLLRIIAQNGCELVP